MIWDDKGNSEKDDWHTYRHEREAILDFVDQEKIDGVILMGGDIHVSRALRYDDRLSYPLWHFISSPMHAGVIPSLNPPHPDLVFGEPEPNVFLKITADTTVDPPALTAEWVKMNGDRLYTVELDAETLSS
jgi:phosphodiesterase/alkaline phosphatase D-like protein